MIQSLVAIICFVFLFVQISYGEMFKPSTAVSSRCKWLLRCPEHKRIDGFCGPNPNIVCCIQKQINLNVKKNNNTKNPVDRGVSHTKRGCAKQIIPEPIYESSCKSQNGNCKPLSECLQNLTIRNVTNCKSKQVCCLNSPPTTEKPVKRGVELLPKDCGLEGRKPMFRIGHGDESEIYEYTWTAILAKRLQNNIEFNSEYRCGAFLISERYVVTAGHCLYGMDFNFFFIRLGEYDLNTRQDCFKGVCASDGVYDIGIERVKMRSEYKSNSIEHDVALIRLNEIIKFGYTVQPICLPTAEYLKYEEFNGTLMEIAGWGQTYQGEVSYRKLKVSLLGMTNHDCNKFYQNVQFTWGQMCAGGNDNHGACRGDSGGPLMYQDLDAYNPNWIAVGINIAGPEECGTGNQPTVFTRMSNQLNWILDNLEE